MSDTIVLKFLQMESRRQILFAKGSIAFLESVKL